MSKELMVTVEANGRSFSFEGKQYRPDKNDRVTMPRRAFNHIQAYAFFNPAVNAKEVFRVGLKEVTTP